MGAPVHKYQPKIADRILDMLNQSNKSYSVKEIFEHLYMAQSPSEPPMKERTVAAILRTSRLAGKIASIGNLRDRVYLSLEEEKIWKEERASILPQLQSEVKKELSVVDLIAEFKALTEVIFEKLRHFDEMQQAMEFWVSEARNMGARPGVVRKVM